MLESTRGARSTTVTLFTRAAMPSAHFNPISPAPTIRTRVLSPIEAARESASSSDMKVNFLSTVSSPANGGTNGDEPVAQISFL